MRNKGKVKIVQSSLLVIKTQNERNSVHHFYLGLNCNFEVVLTYQIGMNTRIFPLSLVYRQEK